MIYTLKALNSKLQVKSDSLPQLCCIVKNLLLSEADSYELTFKPHDYKYSVAIAHFKNNYWIDEQWLSNADDAIECLVDKCCSLKNRCRDHF